MFCLPPPIMTSWPKVLWRSGMRALGLGVVLVLAGLKPASGQTVDFDGQPGGQPPSGWTCGVTGSGTGTWRVEEDAHAPSPPQVLTQRGRADFTWCVQEVASVESGSVSVRFKPMEGKEDQAGGLVWRWKDANTYYVARGNALENNVSLYYVTGGVRRTIKYQAAPVARNVWHRLEVHFQGEQIEVFLDDKSYINSRDRSIRGPGKTGVWTKADSVTSFDDFRVLPK
jgi:hypothetical protein